MPDPDHAASLTHIGELSKNARSIWFGLLGLITFVGVTLMGHRDADFFAVGADTKLPLIGIEVPVTYFFATAFKREATERYAEYTSQLDAPDLHGSDLRNARMAGAFLPGANFRKAEMQGANFFGAQMQGARLGGAQMQGTYLGSADMNGADCSNTRDRGVLSLRGALLNFADVSCDHLTQAHLDGAVGNSGTVLPRGFTLTFCLKTLPEDIEAALAHHPETGDRFRLSRIEVRARLLCGPDGAPHAPETVSN